MSKEPPAGRSGRTVAVPSPEVGAMPLSPTERTGGQHACPHCRCGELGPLNDSTDGLSMQQEAAARDYILAHLADRPLLKDVARHCRIPSSRFARQFKNSIGISCKSWILEQRVSLALTLFHAGCDDISQVASQCGFFDQSHFNRVFKKQLGISPGAWLRSAVSGAHAHQG